MPEGQYDHIAIMAPGPSLCKDQVDMIMGTGKFFTIAIGDAHLLNPFADILYHCDARWWDYYKGVPEFLGCHRVSMEPTKHDEVKQIVKSRTRVGLDLVVPNIVAGCNSGYQAINLAVHYKPKEIILVGYDMKKAADGRYNVRGDHPKEMRSRGKFSTFIEKIGGLRQPLAKQGIKVYNCTIDSDLNCFTRRDLKDVI